MTAKELKIKEAWGIYYHQLTQIDENGWCFQKPVLNLDEIKKNTDLDIHAFGFRPSSLSGIESNNGWISIDSVEDLPELSSDEYFAIDEQGKLHTGVYYYLENTWIKGLNVLKVTHYQPIIKPKLPIY